MPNSPNTDDNDEYNDDDKEYDNSYSDTLASDSLQYKFMDTKVVDSDNEGAEIAAQWPQAPMPYLMSEKYFSFGIFPTSTTMKKDPIRDPWDGST